MTDRPSRLRRQATMMRIINVPMRRILALPFSTPLSKRLMLLYLTGRRSGRSYRQPVSYVKDGDLLLTPGGGNWKLNLEPGRPERIRLGGRDVPARPDLIDSALMTMTAVTLDIALVVDHVMTTSSSEQLVDDGVTARVRGLRNNVFAGLVMLLLEYGLGVWTNLYEHLPASDHGKATFAALEARSPTVLSVSRFTPCSAPC